MERPLPPFPDLVRRPTGPFGWIEARFLHEGLLARLGPEACAVLLLLALAADRRGASYFGRERMAGSLGIDRAAVDRALGRLQDAGLAAQRPWRQGHPDGVWQLLTPPARGEERRGGAPLPVRAVLEALGLGG